MVNSSPDGPLKPTVLDRLLQENDSSRHEYDVGYSIEDLKESVQRNLELLLNTKWRATSWPDSLTELDRSLLNYGIPDFASISMSSNAAEWLRQQIEQTISHHEPRFISVTVKSESSEGDLARRELRFRIEGLLRAIPDPEPVVFDTQLDGEQRRMGVRESDE